MDDRILKEIASYEVSESDAGKLIRTILQERLGMSRRLIRKLVSCKGIFLNDQPVYVTARVLSGDWLRLLVEEETSNDILPESMPIDIVFEDEDLFVVNKPAGLIVHPTSGHYTGTLANGVVAYWAAKGEKIRFRPVHRIDQYTSGLIVIAKTHYSHQQLDVSLRSRNMLREYQAFVHGDLVQDQDTIEGAIARCPEDPHKRGVFADGQPARTHFYVLKRFTSYTWLSLRLDTGRTHQIRVHMSHIGHPLLGDIMYGGSQEKIQRQALHAAKLGFEHPRSRVWMQWEAPLPPDMQNLI